MYYICDSAFSLMPDPKKAEMNNFIDMVNFDYNAKEWAS